MDLGENFLDVYIQGLYLRYIPRSGIVKSKHIHIFNVTLSTHGKHWAFNIFIIFVRLMG